MISQSSSSVISARYTRVPSHEEDTGQPIDEKLSGTIQFSYLAPRARNFISMSYNKPISGIKAPDNRQRYHGSPLLRRNMANTMTTAVVHPCTCLLLDVPLVSQSFYLLVSWA